MKKRALRQLSILMASILSLSLLDIFSPINAYAYGKDEPIIVVSMGDSYSSGEGIEPFYGQKENDDPKGKDLSRFAKIDNDDWLAHRSMYSWPSRLKVGDKAVREHKMPLNKSNGDSEMQWYFVAASGAVTWHFGGKNNDGSWWGEYPHKTVTNVGTVMHPWYETKSKNLDPQLKVFEDNELYGKVDYVTMSIGGNDLDFVDIIATSLEDTISTDISNTVVDLLNKSLTLNVLKVPYIQSPGFIGKRIEDSKKKWNNPWTDKEGKEQKPVKDSLKDAYHRTIDFAGPQADIIVAGYPELYYRETDTATANKKQREIIDNFIIEMCNPVDGKIKEVIKECNTEFANGKIHYVSVIEEFKDKGMDAPGEQWIEGINFWGSEKLDESLRGIMGYSSAHPNKTGAEHYANLVNKKIEEIEESKLNGIISGKVVTENNEPIQNAKVTANNKEVYTNANGEFSLSLPKGNYYFEVTCDGYQPAKIANINVQPGKTTKLNNIVLKIDSQKYRDDFISALLANENQWFNDYGSNVGYPSMIEFKDLDFDGVPELIMQLGGGSMRNCDAYAYSLHDGKLVKSKMFQNVLNYYQDTKTNKKKIVGTHTWRNGVYESDLNEFEFTYDGKDVTTNYFLGKHIQSDSNGTPSYQYYTLEGSLYDYDSSQNTRKKVSDISQDQYDKLKIAKSDGLEPLYVKTDSIPASDYKSYTNSKKKEVLEKAYDSFGYYLRSDEVQYYNGQHYYTPINSDNMINLSNDFSSAKPDYIPITTLNEMFNSDSYGTQKRLSIDNFIIVDDKIYFTCWYYKNGPEMADRLYVCNMDGTNVKLIHDSVSHDFVYYDGKIYYKTVSTLVTGGWYNSGTSDKMYSYDTRTQTKEVSQENFNLYYTHKFASQYDKWHFYQNNDTHYYYDGMMYSYYINTSSTSGHNSFTKATNEQGDEFTVCSWFSQQY